MPFDVEAARADGLSEEEIQAAIAYGNSLKDTEEITTKEEVVVTPEPPQTQPQPQAQPKPTTGFDVEAARADGLTEKEIQEAIEYGKSLEVTPTQPKPTTGFDVKATGFDVEAAKADGLTDIEIQEAIEYGKSLEVTPNQPTQPIPTDVEDTTFFGRVKQSFKEGIESFGDIVAGYDLAFQDITGDKKEATQRMASIKGEAAADNLSRLPTITAQDIQDEFQKSGLIPAGMKVPSFIVEQILKSGPQMIPPILAGIAVASVSGPFAPVTGPVAGIAVYGLQQFGNFMNTQGLEKEAPEELDTASAATWATITAPIGYFADRFTLGLSKIPTKVLSKEISEELVKRTAAKSGIGATLQGGGTGLIRGAVAEAPTEALETWAEFHQAGMDTNSEEFDQAIFESFWSAAAMGGGLGSGTNAYQAHKKWKKSKQIQDEKDLKPDTDSSKENVEVRASDIIKGWQGQNTKKQQRKANQDIKNRSRASLNTLDVDTLAVMGIDEQSTPILYKALLNKSTANKQGREEIREIFEANSGNYANVDATTVNSFLKRIAKPNDPKVKRFNNRRVGASPDVSEQQSDPNQTDTSSIETDERISMDDSTGSTGRTGDGTSQLNDTLIKKNPFNKKLKPKQKRTIAEVINNQVVIRKGEVIKQEDGTLALKEDVSGEIITFNQNQVINPTKKDQGVLSTIAEETKSKEQKTEESVEDFIQGPQFAKDETPSDKQELERLRFAVAEGEYQAGSFMKASEPVPKRLVNRIENDKKKLQEKEQEIAQRPPEQQELFAKGAIENTGETTESITKSFKNQYGNNIDLAVKRGLINIVPNVNSLPSEIDIESIPDNAKAFFMRGSNKAYFIADRIKASDAPSMLLHEIGAHYGLEGMLGQANYDRVVNSLESKRNTDEEIKSAYDYVTENYPELVSERALFIQEVIARIGEQTPDNTLFRQVVGYIKNFLSRLGMGWNVDNISVSEIQDMIQQSLRISLAKTDSTKLTPQTLQKIASSKDPNVLKKPFYSPLRKIIDTQKMPVMDADSWKKYIGNKASRGGFGEEAEVSGLLDFIDLMSKTSTKIPKKLLQYYLDKNEIKIDIETAVSEKTEAELDLIVDEERERLLTKLQDSRFNNSTSLAELGDDFNYYEELDKLVNEKGYDIIKSEEVKGPILTTNKYLQDLVEPFTGPPNYEQQIKEGKFIVGPAKGLRYGYYDDAQGFNSIEEAEQYRDDYNDRFHDEVDGVFRDRIEEHLKDFREQQREASGYSLMQRTGGDRKGYKELVITLDNEALIQRIEEEAERIVAKGQNVYDGMDRRYQIINLKNDLYKDYINGHYGSYPNTLLHIRYDIRTDQDGNEVMWVEELQSDYAEELRLNKLSPNVLDNEKTKVKMGGGEKNRPFVQDTQLWMKLGVKAIIREAAELGVDKVAFLSPAQAEYVHYRKKDAAKVSYGQILPGVIKRVINQLDKSALPTKDSIKKQPKKDQIVRVPQLEIIDLRPGEKPTLADKKDYRFEKVRKRIAEDKLKVAGSKPFYKYFNYKNFNDTVLDLYADVIMRENLGIKVEFKNGQAKVNLSKGETYTKIAMESSYADYEAFMIKEKNEGATGFAFQNDMPGYIEAIKQEYQEAQDLKPLLDRANRLAMEVVKDASIVTNNPEIKNKILKSIKKMTSKSSPDNYGLAKEFLESNMKIEKLIPTDGGDINRAYAILSAPNNEAGQAYTLTTENIYNAPNELQGEINKYDINRENFNSAEVEVKLATIKLNKMENQFVGLKSDEKETSDAELHVGKQEGFTMTPKLTEIALAGQPMFAKQGTKNARKLYNESNPDKPAPKQEQKNKDAFEKNMEEGPVSFASRFANAVFSFDNALNSAIRRAMEAAGVSPELQNKLLTKISLSQALHADSLGDQFVIFGKIKYNPETGKWSAVEGDKNTPTLKKISKSLKTLAKQRGMKLEELRKIAGAAITGKRLQALKKQQAKEIAQAKVEFDKGNTKRAKEILDNLKIIHKTDAEIDAMIKIFDEIPQLNKIYSDWLAIRDEAIDALVVAQKLSQSEVDKYKAEVDFVPFYRIQEQVQRIGPNASTRGLIDNTWYKFKGSYEPVNDVFENMEMWSKYSIRRAVLNQAAINKVDATLAVLPDMVRQVPNASMANTVSIERRNSSGNIETIHYQFADPTFAAAFGGMENLVIPALTFASKIANILRANVVLYPLFSIAQLPQDAVSAMFSSGVKYPFMIPLRVLFEFPATFLNISKTHKITSKSGITGSFGSYAQTAFDVNNRNVKEMGPIRKSIELLTNTPIGEVNEIPISILGILNRLAMASDNAIRQAVYDQTMSETNNVALAEERAFEIINFKRGGSSGAITGLRQVVPFFGAALQALSVQGRMLGGRGIAPNKDGGKLLSASAKQFMSTWAQVTTATLLYNLLMDDSEEYEKLDPALRDRRILLGNGYHITLRPDIFTYMSKMVPEQMFQYIFRGSEDSQKFTNRLKMGLLDVLGNAPVPQVIRPALELAFNESILTDRPIVPQSTESELLAGDPEMQAKASTSELAKLLGEAAGVNPLRVDYFLKQYFGYTMGLGLMLTDEIIADKKINYERASKSERDMIASIPGMSAFITREYGNRHTSDYYELKELVSDAYKSFRALDKKSWDRNKSVEFNNKYASLIKAQDYIKTKDKIISQVRARRSRILNAPANKMNAKVKQQELLKMNKLEQDTLFDIREMRNMVFDDKTGTYRREGQKSNNPFN